MSNDFTCTVDLRNAVFEDNPSELANILRQVADRVDGTSNTGSRIVDSNGKFVGMWLIGPARQTWNVPSLD